MSTSNSLMAEQIKPQAVISSTAFSLQASPLRAGLEKMRQSFESRDDRFGFLALRDEDIELSNRLPIPLSASVSVAKSSASQQAGLLQAEPADIRANYNNSMDISTRQLPGGKAEDSIIIPAEGSALIDESSGDQSLRDRNKYEQNDEVIVKDGGEQDVNQQTRIALRTASIITNKYNDGSNHGGQVAGVAALAMNPNNGKKTNPRSIFFWAKVNSIKRRFVSALIRSVPSARFRHLTSHHFRIINDPAADYGYFLYENHLIFAEVWIGTPRLLLTYQHTKMMAELALIFRGEFVFSQESISRLIWDIFLVIFTFFLIITIPLQHIFEASHEEGTHIEFINTHLTPWILIAEIIVNLNTAIYKDGVVTSNRRKIFQHYFWNFLKDVLILGVFYLANQASIDDGQRKLNYIVLLKYLDVPARLEDVEGKLQVSSSKSDWLKLIKFEGVVLLIAHVTCCLFLLLGLSSTNEGDPSISWIEKYSFQSTSLLEKYAISFYYIIITMTTVGYGDITPSTIEEKLFIIVVALLSTNVFAYTFSQISEIMKNEELKKRSYNKLMQGVNSEMNKRGFNSILQHKIRKYYEHRQSQHEEKSLSRQGLFEELPQTLKEEVLLQINGTVIEEIALLRRFSLECKREIALAIKQKVFFPEETIFVENESNDAIYYVAFGAVTLSLRVRTKLHKNKSLPHLNIKTLPKKSVLGYESFLLKGRNPFSARAEGVTVLSFLESKDLLSILAKFPSDYEIYSMIRDEALLSNKTQKLNMRCHACGDSEHSMFRCPLVNPIFRRVKDNINHKYATLDPNGAVAAHPPNGGGGACYQHRSEFKRRHDYHPMKSIANLTEIQTRAKEVTFQLDKEQVFEELCSIFDESELQDDIYQLQQQQQQHYQQPLTKFMNINDLEGEPISEDSAEEGSDLQNQSQLIQLHHRSNIDNVPSFSGGGSAINVPNTNTKSESLSPQLRYTNSVQKPIAQINLLSTTVTTARSSPKASENQQLYRIEEEERYEGNRSAATNTISKRISSSNNITNTLNNNNNTAKGISDSYYETSIDPRIDDQLSPQNVKGSSRQQRNGGYTPDRQAGFPQLGSSQLSINDAISQNSVITKSKKGYLGGGGTIIQRGDLPALTQLGSQLRIPEPGSSVAAGASTIQQSGAINSLLDQVFVRRAERAQRTILKERMAINEMQSRENNANTILNKFGAGCLNMLNLEDQKQLTAVMTSGKQAAAMQQFQSPQQLFYIEEEDDDFNNRNMFDDQNYFEDIVGKNPIIVVEPALDTSAELHHTIERTKSGRTVTAGPVLMQSAFNKQFSAFAIPQKRYSLREHVLEKGGVFGNGSTAPAGFTPTAATLAGLGTQSSAGGASGFSREWKSISGNKLGNPLRESLKRNTSIQMASFPSSSQLQQGSLPTQIMLSPLALTHGQSVRQQQQSQQQQQRQLQKWNTTNTCQADSHSVEYMIRCKEELMDLDLLICRKNLRLLQEKGELDNYILAPDNEISIDSVKEWQIYYKRFNVAFVLHRIRKFQEDFIGIKPSKSVIASKYPSQRRQQQQSQQQKITDSVTSFVSRSVANFEKKK